MNGEVYLPAIAGHVPPGMVCALSAFLDFCYLVQHSVLNETTLDAIDVAVDHFHLGISRGWGKPQGSGVRVLRGQGGGHQFLTAQPLCQNPRHPQ